MHTPSLYRIYGLPLFVQRFLVMILMMSQHGIDACIYTRVH